jgi:hypothetical protein
MRGFGGRRSHSKGVARDHASGVAAQAHAGAAGVKFAKRTAGANARSEPLLNRPLRVGATVQPLQPPAVP